MIDLFIYLIFICVAVFVGFLLGKNFTKLKYQKEQAALQERNSFLNHTIQENIDELKNFQDEKSP